MPNDLLTFRLTDPDGLGASADDWARVLSAMQRLVYALVLSSPGAPKANTELKRRYELRTAGHRSDGSMLLSFGVRQLAFDLNLGTSPAEIRRALASTLQAIANADADALGAHFPDPAHRRAALRDALKLLPKSPERWRLDAELEGAVASLGPETARWVTTMLARGANAHPVTMTVTGELVGVDFEKGTFAVRYAPTGRVLEGRYAPDEEVALLKSRRKLVHVSGEFALDTDDHPHKLKRALKVSLVDLSPVSVREARVGESGFAIHPPLSLVPTMDAESQQLYEVEDAALGLYVAAPTREALERDVRAEVDRLATTPSRAWKRLLTANVPDYEPSF